MKALEIFSAGIRLVGLYFLGRGLLDVFWATMDELQITSRSVTASPPVASWIIGVACVAIGLYFLRGAPLLVNYSFPNDPNGTDSNEVLGRDSELDEEATSKDNEL